jgi:hypothetical protein
MADRAPVAPVQLTVHSISDSSLLCRKSQILPDPDGRAASQQNWRYTDFHAAPKGSAPIVSSTSPLVDSAPEPQGRGLFSWLFPSLIIDRT